MTGARVAKKQFEVNLARLGPNAAQSNPEEFNLYAGLANLAEELQRLSADVQQIKTLLTKSR